MRKLVVFVAVLGCVMFLGGIAVAQEKGPVQTAVETALVGCEKEFNSYCKNVTPGEGRLLACLYAYSDKLSNRCEFALYDAAAQLERVVNTLSYLASECKDDLKKYCSNVKPGEGRLLECVAKQKDKLSGRCKAAIKDVSQK